MEEQLELARTQDEMRPDLRVVEVRLLDSEDSDFMEGSVGPPWMTRLRNLREVGPLSAMSTFAGRGGCMTSPSRKRSSWSRSPTAASWRHTW